MRKYDKSASVQISAAFETPFHVDCQKVFLNVDF